MLLKIKGKEVIMALKIGQTLYSTDGEPIVVKGFIGEGGQGGVYRVTYGGREMALKWYHPLFVKNINSIAFYKNLQANIRNRAPSESFVWPEALTTWSGKKEDCFGYIMKLIPKEYSDLTSIYMKRSKFDEVFSSRMFKACVKIAEAFDTLHNRGYSYQDINDGNFYINVKTGDVLICDNDNVTTNSENLGVIGKQRYMAPEIVLGKMPDRYSDRFSLAVVLFRLLFVGQHPLEGQYSTPPCMTERLEKIFYGQDPVFIFDPQDARNKPTPILNKAAMVLWPYYPDFIKSLFIKTFNKSSYQNPYSRLVVGEFITDFTRLRSSVVACPKCGKEIILQEGKETTCHGCGAVRRAIVYVDFNGIYRTPAAPGTMLYSEDGPDAFAEFLLNREKTVLSIKNLTQDIWRVVYTDNRVEMVQHGQSVPVEPNMKIYISSTNVLTIQR